MLIYCLSSLSQLPTSDDTVHATPYEEDAVEKTVRGSYCKDTIENVDNYSEFFNDYKLTEISMGYELCETKRVYFMIVYRDDTDVIKIPMVRGAVTFTREENKVYEFFIFTSKIFDELDFDIKLKIRCIRNTVKGLEIKGREEEYYENYIKRIKDFCDSKQGSQEYAFKVLKSFKLPGTSNNKVYKQRIRDIENFINSLCDPKNGCFENAQKNSRINTKIKTFLATTSIAERKKLYFRAENYQEGWYDLRKELIWKNANANSFKIDESKEIKSIVFKKITNLFDSANTICEPIKNINFTHLTELSLMACNIRELNDEFILLLPSTLMYLDLKNDHFNKTETDNDITFISETISYLTNLTVLCLNENKNLGDSGFPWNCLPLNITHLNLQNTLISNIPPEIKRLRNLRYLAVESKLLKEVSWKNISTKISELYIEGGESKINEIFLTDKINLSKLWIRNAGITEINYLSLPQNITKLWLNNNKLKFFDGRCLSRLRNLSLGNNCLESIEWSSLASSLYEINVEENNLKRIENISHLNQLRSLDASTNKIEHISDQICDLKNLNTLSLKDNQLQKLPIGFENLSKLTSLYLSNNQFNYFENDLNKVLWKRIPTNVKTLTLSDNHLCELPCISKQFNFTTLHVDNCQLEHICPHIFNKKENKIRWIFMPHNPKIHCLPLLPRYMFLSKTDIKNMNIFASGIEVEEPSTDVKEIFYDFKNSDITEETNACKCCAICGETTDKNMVQQKMLMDFELCIYETPEQRKTYKRRKWITNIITRLCQTCNNNIQAKNGFLPSIDTVIPRKRKEVAPLFDDDSDKRPLIPVENSDSSYNVDSNNYPNNAAFNQNDVEYTNLEFSQMSFTTTPIIPPNNDTSLNDPFIVSQNMEQQFSNEMFENQNDVIFIEDPNYFVPHQSLDSMHFNVATENNTDSTQYNIADTFNFQQHPRNMEFTEFYSTTSETELINYYIQNVADDANTNVQNFNISDDASHDYTFVELTSVENQHDSQRNMSEFAHSVNHNAPQDSIDFSNSNLDDCYSYSNSL